MEAVVTMESFLECCGSSVFATEMSRNLPFSSLDHAIDTARTIWWNQVNVFGWLEAFAAHPRIGDIEALRKKFPSDKGCILTFIQSTCKRNLQKTNPFMRMGERIMVDCWGAISSFGDCQRASLTDPMASTNQDGELYLEITSVTLQERVRVKFGEYKYHISKGGYLYLSAEVKELAEWNKRYESKFGHIFLICATGRPSHEILAALKKRFTNRAIEELKVAAQEQMKITELRLAKLNIWPSKESGVETKSSSEKSVKDGLQPPITTHVLDVSVGRPGAGIDVKLERCVDGEEDCVWECMGTSVTNLDGRCGQLMENSNLVQAGTYRLTFETGKYLLSTQGGATLEEGKSVFYPFVQVVFKVRPHQVSEHFHVPLLFSPYSYTIYRGS